MTAQETQGGPSIEHLCQLSGVSRAGFYRFGEVHAPKRTEADLRDKIQKIALDNRFYGYRRICRDLWRLHGLKVNHKHMPHASCARTICSVCAGSRSFPSRPTAGMSLRSCPI
jgi:hypothetical protein